MAATEFVSAPWASPLSVSSALVDGPTFEPLTLDEAKLRAGLDWAPGDPRDSLMLGLIAAARQRVEADTGLAIAQQTRRVTIRALAGLPLPVPAQTIPTQSITEWAPGTEAHGRAVPAVSWLGASWLFPTDYAGTWTVVAGWPSIEALKAEAPLLVHACGLLVAHLATLGRDLATVDEPYLVPLGYDEAIQPYRIERLV